MTFGAEIWGPPLVAAGASWLSGQGSAPKETKLQKTQRHLVDSVLESLSGKGPYADLYNADENTFQKSFVEPAQAKFRNQIAPQIQQEYIASGQQRGTGLDDQLLRAGVDLDSLLNQHMMEFQQGAMNRKQNAINSVFSAGPGAPNETTGFQDAMSGLSGYLSSDQFSDTFSNYLKPKPNTTAPPQFPNTQPTRRGFEPEWKDWKVGDPRWGTS